MQNVTVNPFKLIGLAIRTTNEGQKANTDIANLWQQFLANNLIAQIPNKKAHTIYSLYTEYEGDHTKPYTVILGCKVHSLDHIPEGMVGKSFNGGTYMKTSVKGDLTKGIVVRHWTEIWAMDVKRAFTADFETYSEKAQNQADAEVDFYIALRE